MNTTIQKGSCLDTLGPQIWTRCRGVNNWKGYLVSHAFHCCNHIPLDQCSKISNLPQIMLGKFKDMKRPQDSMIRQPFEDFRRIWWMVQAASITINFTHNDLFEVMSPDVNYKRILLLYHI